MPARSPAEIIQRFVDHLAAGELDQIVALYEPDAVYFARPGRPLSGQDIRSAFAALIDRGARMSGECVRAVEAAGLALVNNRWSVAITGHSGTGHVGGLSCVVLRQRAGGTWGVVIDDPWDDQRVAVAGGSSR
jgi:ketosteroid isomerase-like protein